MFERFTERSRRVVVLAQEESGRLGYDYVGTEHLLLGLIREEEGVAAQALAASGVTVEGTREQVETIVGYGEADTSQKPFRAESKRVLESSLKESMRLGHNYIGTEHILLGLLAEGGSITATVLSNLDTDTGRVRREVVDGLEGGARYSAEGGLGTLGWAREALRRPFGRYPRPEDRASFEKFTYLGRRVMVLAQDEARRFNHNYIGTEHLLLGLIGEEGGIAARSLRVLGVDLDEAREQVESIVGYGEEGTGAQAPFTPRTRKVLQLALREALQLGHDHVSTEHVLLGLVRESEGVVARVLLDLDVSPDAVRQEVIKRLLDAGEDPDPPDEAGQEVEELEHWTLFRGRVGGIGAALDLPRPVAVAADADYAYRARADSFHRSTTVEPGDVADAMRAGLRETGARELEAVIAALGERLLGAFPAMLEVTVTVSGPPEPADPPGPTFSVSATFRR